MTPETPVALDTSVAIPWLMRSHPMHRRVSGALSGRRTVLAGHAMLETYAVLTRLPASASLGAEDVCALLDSNFRRTVFPRTQTLAGIHRRLAAHGIAGGATYDALVACAAIDHDLTLLSRDRRAEQTYRAIGVKLQMLPD